MRSNREHRAYCPVEVNRNKQEKSRTAVEQNQRKPATQKRKRTQVRATIEAIWSLGEAWQKSQFPLSKLLKDPGNTNAAVDVFHAIQKKFVSKYVTGQINLGFLEQSYMVRTKVNCPGNVGLDYLKIDQSFADEYVFDSDHFAEPHKTLLDMTIGKEWGDVMTDVSVKRARYDPSDKKKHNKSRPDYSPMAEQRYGGWYGPRDNCVLIKQFADFLFFTPRISAHLKADRMKEIGPIYSALLLMAHDITPVGVNAPAVSSPTSLANKYGPAISQVMKAAQQVYRYKGGINCIQPSTFNQLLDQGAGSTITPIYRSNTGTIESPVWQDYARNRHRPPIRVEHGIHAICFKAEEWTITSGFYGLSNDDAMHPFRSSVRWNYPSSVFLYASAELAADMMSNFNSTNLDSLLKMVLLARQFVVDLSQFEVSFANFFAMELLPLAW